VKPVRTSCTVCDDPDAVIYDLLDPAPVSELDVLMPLLGQLGLCERCRDLIATGWVMVQPWPSAVNA